MSYLPSTEAGLLNWARNFRDELVGLADPTAIGLTAAEVTEYDAAFQDYDTTYEAANEPSTRGGATILAKNEAKQKLIGLSRSLGMSVARNANVTDQQRYAMGLPVRDTQPTPVPPPADPPQLTIASRYQHTVRIRLADSANPTSRARPDGVIGATVLSYVGDQPPADISTWKFEGNTGQTIVDVDFPLTVPPATKVWFTAFWFNTRKQAGPACNPVSAYLDSGMGEVAEAA